MQTRDSTNKSPIKLSMQWKINWHDDLFTNEENLHGKNPTGWFLGHHSRESTIVKTSIISKGIPVPYTNLQLNPYPNTQLDLFYSENFSFWCMTPSTWLTNCADPSTRLRSPTREHYWLRSSSVHPNDEDRKDAWSQNPTMHKHSNFFTRKMN